MGPIALFGNSKLTNSSENHLEYINHAHVVSLMYRILTIARGCDDLSIGFYRSCDKRQRELTNNNTLKSNFHLRISLRDVFGFNEHQETGTFGLDYKLTLTRNTDNAVLNKDNAIYNGKIKINAIEWYIPYYTASIEQLNILMNQIMKKTPTELQYAERSVFMKELNTQNFWTFE